jgi:hypothetical protein
MIAVSFVVSVLAVAPRVGEERGLRVTYGAVARAQDAQPAGDRGDAAATPGGQPSVTSSPTNPTILAPPTIVDYSDPTYGGRIRQLRKDDGHEHNLYYYRDPWNADGSALLGIQSDLQQKNWHVVLYDGDGHFLNDLFSVDQYDWRLPPLLGCGPGLPLLVSRRPVGSRSMNSTRSMLVRTRWAG